MWFTLSQIFLFVVSSGSLLYFSLLCIFDTAAPGFSYIWLCIGIGAGIWFFIRKLKGRKTRTARQQAAFIGSRRKELHRIKPFTAFIVSAAVIAVLCAAVILDFILIPLHDEQDGEAGYILVPGTGIRQNGELSQLLIARLDTAVQYLYENPRVIAIVSGGQGVLEPFSEAQGMAEYLIAAGIPEERIIQEDKSKDTIENFLFSRRIIAAHGGTGQKMAIVTNTFHLARSMLIARRTGFTNIEGIAAPLPPLLAVNAYAREILAVVKLGLYIAVTGQPSPEKI